MRALVPYASRGIVRSYARYRFGRYIRAARVAGYMARGLYRNRKRIRTVARFVMRKRRRTASSRFDGDRARGPSNQAWYDSTGANTLLGRSTIITLGRKKMYSAVLEIAKAPSALEKLGQPARNEIKLKGLKICLNAELPSFVTADTTMVHIALVQPKGFDTVVSPVDLDSFFSRPGGGIQGSDRTENFVEFATDPAVNWDFNCNGINTQKWNVITHVKRVLKCKGDAHQSGTSILRYEKYMSMKKKRIMWDSINSNFQTRPLVLLVWHERLISDVNTSFNINFNVSTTSYFMNI